MHQTLELAATRGQTLVLPRYEWAVACRYTSGMDIFSPFAGHVRFEVTDGQPVSAGDRLAVVEAVKIEAPVAAPGPGVARLGTVADFSVVAGGDFLLHLDAPADGEDGS